MKISFSNLKYKLNHNSNLFSDYQNPEFTKCVKYPLHLMGGKVFTENNDVREDLVSRFSDFILFTYRKDIQNPL